MSRTLQITTHVVSWTSFLVAIASCMLRCYYCKIIKRSWQADDFMSLVVGVFVIAALVIWQRAFALGCLGPTPNSCKYYDSSGDVLTWFFIISIVHDAVLHFVVRSAFLTFYFRFTTQSNLRFWIGMGFGMNGMLLIFNVLIIVFRCKPVTAAFRPTELNTAQCMEPGFALIAPAVLNTVLNLYVILLPAPIYYSIQLPIRRKVHICCIFAVGGAAVALGLIRIRSLWMFNTGTRTLETIGEMMIVGALGMSLAAIAHNMPSMRVFWIHVRSRSKVKCALQRPCEVKSRNRFQETTIYSLEDTVSGTNFSRPIAATSALSTTSLVDRPLPALPNGIRQPRYPTVDDDFGRRPRTPPHIR